MRRATALCLVVTLVVGGLAQAALANGYDVYAPPLSWSPNGQLLAAAVNSAWPREGTLAAGALRLYGRNGEIVAELAQGECGTPSFSPDGRLLAAVVDSKLAIFEVPSGQPWTGFAPPADSPALGGKVLDCAWLADGQRGSTIWYTAGERFYGCRCYTLDPATGQGAEVWADSAGGSVLAPQPAPGGRFMVALHQNAAGGSGEAAYERLFAWPRDGQAKQATRSYRRADDYHESNALFLDGHTVLFQRGGWGDWRLYRVDLATGSEYIEAADAQQPALDAGRRWLAFTRRDYQAKQSAEYDWDLPSSVIVRDRERLGEYAASTPDVYAELPALTPDGTRIAWLERGRDGQAQVGVRTLAGLIHLGPGIAPGAHAPAGAADPASAALAAAQAALDGAAAATVTSTQSKETPAMSTDATRVVFETTKGKLVLAVHPAWAPVGAAHFLELVRAGYYNGAPWFRVIDGFVAQCGIAADPAVNAKWENVSIQDDPVKQGNTRGFVSYGQTSAPNSRGTHIFINYGDNSRLDAMRFAAFAEVVEGMDVADRFTRCEYQDQGRLSGPGGLEDFQKKFPGADYITKAYVEQ
jgi:peptidyl-prolyl cis-trans isomerase A (cyclophilin A)